MPDSETRTWYDWRGYTFEAPAHSSTCFDNTGKWRTHYLFAPNSPTVHQAITLCGLRAGEFTPEPAAEVSCRECRDARA